VLPFGGLGVTYTVHLWLVGKRVVDFLLVLIERFRQLSRLRRCEQILVEIVLLCLKGGWVTLSANFTNKFWRQKTRFPGLSRGVVCVILCLAVFSERDTKAGFIAGQLNSTRRRVELRRGSVHSGADATRRRVVETYTVHQRSTIISERRDPVESICRARRKL